MNKFIYKMSNNSLVFEDIEVTLNVNEIYTKTSTTIKFKNNDSNAKLELCMNIPLAPNSVMQSFEAIKGNEKIISKVYKKEKAEEKYSDSMAKGNNAIMTKLSKDSNTVDVYFGNLDPLIEFSIIINTLQLNSAKDKSISFSIQPFYLPKINNQQQIQNMLSGGKAIINYKVNINAKSPITRLISYDIDVNKLKKTFSENFSSCEISVLYQDIYPNLSKEISFVFRTDKITSERIFEEHDTKLDVYTYNVNFMVDKYENIVPLEKNSIPIVDTDARINYVEKHDAQLINDYPGSFIFLVDQSGSMSGNSIKIAREALVLFLKSIPQGSRFDIIGFGSSSKTYFKEPLEYSEDNINMAVEMVRKIEADLGGTNIYQPLNLIYVLSKYNLSRNYGEDMPKAIFLLTDGAADDPVSCVNIAKTYAHEYKIHSIGIGTDVDTKFVKDIGLAGDGSFHIVPNVNDLNQVVIKALNKASIPYLSKIDIEIPEEIKTATILSYPDLSNSPYYKQDEIFSYSFISSKKLSENSVIKVSYFDKSLEQNVEKEIEVKDKIVRSSGNDLNKIVAGLRISKNSLKDNEENEKLSVMFQVLTPFSGLFAEIDSENSTLETKKIEILSGLSYKDSIIICAEPYNYGIVDENTEQLCIEDDFDCELEENFLCSNIQNDISANYDPPLKNLSMNRNSSNCNLASSDLSCTSNKMMMMDDNFMCNDSVSSCKEEEFDSPKKRKKESNNISVAKKEKEEKPTNVLQNKKLNGDFNSFDTKFYQILIDLQNSEGLWKKDCSDTLVDSIKKKYSDKAAKLEEILKNSNLKLLFNTTIEDLVQTIIVLIILNENYATKKEEFKLLENKTIKSLLKNGVKYLDVIKGL